MAPDDAQNALLLEEAYNEYQGTIEDTRDAIIEDYVKLCRKYASRFNIGSLYVEPDYMVLTDRTGRYCLVFLLKAGETVLGDVSECYTDDSSITLSTSRMTLTISLKGIDKARRRRIHE